MVIIIVDKLQLCLKKFTSNLKMVTRLLMTGKLMISLFLYFRGMIMEEDLSQPEFILSALKV